MKLQTVLKAERAARRALERLDPREPAVDAALASLRCAQEVVVAAPVETPADLAAKLSRLIDWMNDDAPEHVIALARACRDQAAGLEKPTDRPQMLGRGPVELRL